MDIARRGFFLVVSAPSGCGKTSILRSVASGSSFAVAISATTRPARPGEADGVDYRFLTPGAFQAMRGRGEFLEHAEVFGHFYGTPRAPIDDAIAEGRVAVGDADWQGVRQLRAALGGDLVSVFLLPPSIDALEERLNGRGDAQDIVRARMARAVDEASHAGEYDHVLVNESFNMTVLAVHTIIAAERTRRSRLVGLDAFTRALATRG